jgi:hypothetical protein
MRFNPVVLDAFVKSGVLKEKPEPRFPRHEVATWFPPAVLAALEPLGKDHMRVKGRRFEATPFVKGAGTPGSLFVLDGGAFAILRRPEP